MSLTDLVFLGKVGVTSRQLLISLFMTELERRGKLSEDLEQSGMGSVLMPVPHLLLFS
jgi:hypothetical protein